MELHPFLEFDTPPNPGWWYVLTTTGDCPSMRVGHTCTYMRGQRDDDAGRVYVIGGANPSGPFCETYVLDLNTRTWDVVESVGLRPRYEHAAFAPPSCAHKIYVVGGANQAGNLNDIQVLDTVSNTWSTVAATGSLPTPRTHHTTATIGDKLIVYSGGHQGADPVGDRQVHCFDAIKEQWSVLTLKGESPKPRHGHIMVSVGSRVFLHGGMAGSTFYDDLHILDLEKNAWVNIKKKKIFPSARAAHGAVCSGTNIFMFGGMNRDGALDDLYKLDTMSMVWTQLQLHGPPPASRLDFAICMIELQVPRLRTRGGGDDEDDLSKASGHAREVLEHELKPGSASSRDSWTDGGEEASCIQANNKGEKREDCRKASAAVESDSIETVWACLVNGGMDTEGEIFDDTLIFPLM